MWWRDAALSWTGRVSLGDQLHLVPPDSPPNLPHGQSVQVLAERHHLRADVEHNAAHETVAGGFLQRLQTAELLGAQGGGAFHFRAYQSASAVLDHQIDIGTALLTHGVARLQGAGAVATAAWWAVLGVVLMVLLLRVVDFHQRDFSSEAPAGHPTRRVGWASPGASAFTPSSRGWRSAPACSLWSALPAA